jgi:hypothetical protein
MKLTACLLALVGAASGLVISPPAVPRAGVVTRHRALFMQEDDDQTKRRHQRNTLPMLRHCTPHPASNPTATARLALLLTLTLTVTRGVSGVLGGGKTTADVEKNPIAEAGSLAAFVIVISAIVFGGLVS